MKWDSRLDSKDIRVTGGGTQDEENSRLVRSQELTVLGPYRINDQLLRGVVGFTSHPEDLAGSPSGFAAGGSQILAITKATTTAMKLPSMTSATLWTLTSKRILRD
jgi:hypothetical protein